MPENVTSSTQNQLPDSPWFSAAFFGSRFYPKALWVPRPRGKWGVEKRWKKPGNQQNWKALSTCFVEVSLWFAKVIFRTSIRTPSLSAWRRTPSLKLILPWLLAKFKARQLGGIASIEEMSFEANSITTKVCLIRRWMKLWKSGKLPLSPLAAAWSTASLLLRNGTRRSMSSRCKGQWFNSKIARLGRKFSPPYALSGGTKLTLLKDNLKLK